jgi:hypothetical protein
MNVIATANTIAASTRFLFAAPGFTPLGDLLGTSLGTCLALSVVAA